MDDDIAFRFGIHQSTFSILSQVSRCCESFNYSWSDRVTLRETLPYIFRKFLKKDCIIMDCTGFLLNSLLIFSVADPQNEVILNTTYTESFMGGGGWGGQA